MWLRGIVLNTLMDLHRRHLGGPAPRCRPATFPLLVDGASNTASGSLGRPGELNDAQNPVGGRRRPARRALHIGERRGRGSGHHQLRRHPRGAQDARPPRQTGRYRARVRHARWLPGQASVFRGHRGPLRQPHRARPDRVGRRRVSAHAQRERQSHSRRGRGFDKVVWTATPAADQKQSAWRCAT